MIVIVTKERKLSIDMQEVAPKHPCPYLKDMRTITVGNAYRGFKWTGNTQDVWSYRTGKE